jgi:hypothetical protein
VHVDCDLQKEDVPAFQSWLDVHAGQLRSVQLTAEPFISNPKYTQQLPLDKLSQLQHLQLKGFRLRLPGEGSWSCSPNAGGSHSSTDGSSMQHNPS